MIKFKLICDDCNICFDSWFSSSNEYEKLKKNFFLNCVFCDSLNVKKTLMSPSVLKSKNMSKAGTQNLKYGKIKKTMLEYQKFIKNNFDYVGQNFAYEARSMHYKNKKARGIYGIATTEDVKELNDEGIKTELMPWLKNKAN